MNLCTGGGSDEEKQQRDRSKAIDRELRKEKVEFKATHRLLLLGEKRREVLVNCNC